MKRSLKAVSRRFDGYLSLASKAGKLVFGEEQIVKAAQRGEARLLLVDAAAGKNTKDRYQRLGQHHGILLLEAEGLGTKAGKSGRMAAALTDEGFALAIKKVIGQE